MELLYSFSFSCCFLPAVSYRDCSLSVSIDINGVGSTIPMVSGVHWGSWNVCPANRGDYCNLNLITGISEKYKWDSITWEFFLQKCQSRKPKKDWEAVIEKVDIMGWRLDKNIVSMLNFLNLIAVQWLYQRMFF